MAGFNIAPRYEADELPELGHLVDGFDFRRLTAWAQEQATPYNPNDPNPVNAIPIRINGRSATVGSIGNDTSHQTGGERFRISSHEIGRRNVFIVEDSADVQVFRYWPYSRFQKDLDLPVVKAEAQDEVPAHIGLGIIDFFHVHQVEGPQDKAWFVALFEVPELSLQSL